MKLCIVGTGRSGTTLLWRMMNSHPDLFVYRETHWIPALHEAFGTLNADTGRMMDLVARTRHVTGSPTTAVDWAAFRASPGYRSEMTVVQFCDALGLFLAQAEGKSLWGDKTPDYGYFLGELQMYWPDCRIIHIIRDGAYAVHSMSRHIGFKGLVALGRMHWCPVAMDFTPPQEPFAQMQIGCFADLWHDRLVRIRDEATRLTPGSYLEVRHEDMIADTEAQLRRIARFCALSEAEDWLTAAEGMVDRERATRARPVGMLADFAPRHLRLLAELGYDATVAPPGPPA